MILRYVQLTFFSQYFLDSAYNSLCMHCVNVTGLVYIYIHYVCIFVVALVEWERRSCGRPDDRPDWVRDLHALPQTLRGQSPRGSLYPGQHSCVGGYGRLTDYRTLLATEKLHFFVSSNLYEQRQRADFGWYVNWEFPTFLCIKAYILSTISPSRIWFSVLRCCCCRFTISLCSTGYWGAACSVVQRNTQIWRGRLQRASDLQRICDNGCSIRAP